MAIDQNKTSRIDTKEVLSTNGQFTFLQISIKSEISEKQKLSINLKLRCQSEFQQVSRGGKQNKKEMFSINGDSFQG